MIGVPSVAPDFGLESGHSQATFDDWTQQRSLLSLGSNAGSALLPFQGWRPFKEAFAPELIEKAISQSHIAVRSIVDPFGGSGTTALAAQLLGRRPTTIEVNPFLADLIESKLCQYDFDNLKRTFRSVVERASGGFVDPGVTFVGAPSTFIEPGVKGRYIFPYRVAGRLAAFRRAIEEIPDEAIQRLFRVLLAGIAVPVSNVVVSGKGRRYRRNWQERQPKPALVDRLFREAVSAALFDLRRFQHRRCLDYSVLRGDARKLLDRRRRYDLAVFSPPYPNSFDYTDVYNVELWTMGYLDGRIANRTLRESTLRSHVQIKRDMHVETRGSRRRRRLVSALDERRQQLWNPLIPEMIDAYFDDMNTVLTRLYDCLRPGARAFLVVGDSRYGGVNIPVAATLAAEAPAIGYYVVGLEPFRSMRTSPQQGGHQDLAETLLILER